MHAPPDANPDPFPAASPEPIPDWTRRRFLAASAAAAVLSVSTRRRSLAQTPTSRSLAPPPEPFPQTSPEPLLQGSTARPLRYTPDAGAFRIRNGREFFNRPLYGPNNAFRVDAGDLPEFSLYLPGHGGNLRVGLHRPSGSKWLSEADEVVTRYLSGQMLYTVRDPLLGKGAIELHLLTEAAGAGLHLTVSARDTPSDLLLTWAFGGVSGRLGKDGGDIGCEIEPVGRFFQLQPEDCNKNSYILHASTADLVSEAARLHLTFPPGARLHLSEAVHWNAGWQALQQTSEDSLQPILVGSVPLDPHSPTLHLLIRETAPAAASLENAREALSESSGQPPPPAATPQTPAPPPRDPSVAFANRIRQLATLSERFRVTTPDPFLDAAAGALVHATDALWDESRQCLLQGAVASRSPLPGWRGPYALDALGSHDRMRANLRFWASRQNQTPLPASQDPDAPVTGPADPGTHLTRKDALLRSNGDLSGTPANMNLVFFDAFFRHLRWTGDVDLARELWPALTRHMDREYRLFRRTYASPDPHAVPNLQTLPLYEAYACIPAAVPLHGNGGGSTHATAYNYFLNRSAATLARVIDEDPAPFDEEADLIHESMRQLLWMPEAGAFAEARDLLPPRTLLTSPALCTASLAIDAELANPRQAWQIATDRLSALPRLPVHGDGVPPGSHFLLPSTDWLPSPLSTTSIHLADNMHFALALWQAGLPDQAFDLFQGNLLDSMYQGLCPGNLHGTSPLDPHRGETQRDLGDSVGATARALVEGLFGILPDLLRATLTIRPGFPSAWNEAALHHPSIDLAWRRSGLSETLEITSRLPHPVALTLILPARTTSDPVVLSNGLAFPFAFDPDATGAPRLILTNFPAATAWKIDIRWHGNAPIDPPPRATYRLGDTIALPPGATAAQLDDPQVCLLSGVAVTPGQHAVFLPIRQGSCRYWLPLPLNILPEPPPSTALLPQSASSRAKPTNLLTPSTVPAPETCEPLDLSALLENHIADILGREYTAPRSPFCSLSLPDHLVGSGSGPAPTVDDTGLRSANGTLHAVSTSRSSPFNIPFTTPADPAQPNCRLLSFWQPDQQRIELALSGQARILYLLMAGTTFPEASHTVHGTVTVLYTDGSTSLLNLRSPDTWWPIEQDLPIDHLLTHASAPPPPRIDLRTGKTRILDLTASTAQRGGPVPGGAANLLHLPLHPDRTLASLQLECTLYGVVLGLIAATLGR